MPKAMSGSAGPSGAETVVASEATESGLVRPGVPEELTVPPEGSQVMLGPTAMEEEDEVEEIVHDEP